MQRAIHPAVAVVAVVLVVGIAIYFFIQSQGPPKWSASQREKARQMLLGVNTGPNPGQQQRGGPSGLLFPQSTPPGGARR